MPTTTNTPTWTADDLGITSQIFLELLTDGIVEEGETIVMSRKTAPREDGKRSGFLPSRWPRSATSKKDHVSIGLQRETTDGPGQGGGQSSKLVNWTGMWALVLDDVLEKVPAPKNVCPTVIIETKPGSQQWWFVFELPVRDREMAEKLVQAAIDAGLSDPGMSNVIRWARLPGSQPAGKQFKARVVHWEPGLLFTPETVIEALGLTLPKWDYWDAHSDFDISEMGGRIDDPVLAFMEQQGMVEGMSGRDWVVIECPHAEEHTDQNERAAYYTPLRENGGGVFKCHHGHGGHPPTQAQFIEHLSKAGAPKATTDALTLKSVKDLTELADFLNLPTSRDNVTSNRDAAPVAPREMGQFVMNVDPDPDAERLDDWIYLMAGQGGFVHKNAPDNVVSIRSFDLAMHRLGYDVSEVKDKNTKKTEEKITFVSPSKRYMEQKLPVYYDVMYMPHIDDDLVEYKGMEYYNSFRPETVPVPVEGDAGALCEAHIRKILPAGADTVIQWMAYVVQNPGKKVEWCLLLLGAEGDGKNAISMMVTAAIGRENAKTVSPDLLKEGFTDWANGRMFTVLNEIMIPGERRASIMNKLKPFISDVADVSCSRKGRVGLNFHNVTSYMALTNHLDAVAPTEKDRRWGVYKTVTFDMTRQEIDAFVPRAHFDALYDVIYNRGGELRRWLLDVDLTGFDHRMAPLSEDKEAMIAATRSNAWMDVDEALMNGGTGVYGDVLIVSHLRELIAEQTKSRPPSSMQIARILEDMKWRKADARDGRMRHGGKVEVVWYKPGPDISGDIEVLRRALDWRQCQRAGAKLDVDAKLAGTS